MELETYSSDFPTAGDQINSSKVGQLDIVFFILSSDGNSFHQSTFIGGSANDEVFQYSFDTSSSCSTVNCKIYISGRTWSTDFPLKNAINSTFPATQTAIFVFSYEITSIASNSVLFSTYIASDGGTGSDWNYAWGTFVDPNGDIFITGSTEPNGIPTTPESLQSTSGGNTDNFMVKLASNGSSILSSTYLGGSDQDQIMFGGMDNTGNIIIGGFTKSSNYPTTLNAFDTSLSAGHDIFISKISNNGSTLLGSTLIGGNSIEFGWGFTVDDNDNMFVTGYTTSNDFPLTDDYINATFTSVTELMLFGISSNAQELIYSTHLQGAGDDIGMGLVFGNNNDLYLSGFGDCADLTIPREGYNDTLSSVEDAFILKLTLDNVLPTIQLSSLTNSSVISSSTVIELDISDNYNVIKTMYGWDGSCSQSFSINYQVNALPGDGQKVLDVCAQDHVGNWENSTFSFIIDDTAPLILLKDKLNNSQVKSGIDIELIIEEANSLSSTTYQWNGGSVISLPISNQITTPLLEGLNMVTVNATDIAGNSKLVMFTFIVDNTTPTVTLQSPDADHVYQSGTIITHNIIDDNLLNIVYYNWDDGELVELSDPYEVTLISSDGEHTLGIFAKDAAGNWKNSTLSYTTDDTTPTAVISNIVEGSILSDSVTIDVAPSDENGIKEVKFLIGEDIVKTVTISPYIYVLDTTKYDEGTYKITIVVTDIAGNELSKVYNVEIANELDLFSRVDIIAGAAGVIIPVFGFIYIKSFKFRNRKIINMYRNDVDIETISKNTGKTPRKIKDILKKAHET